MSYDRALWWLTPHNSSTGVSGTPRVVQATDWSAAEFTATDWTIAAIPLVDPTVWVPNAAAVILPIKVYRTGGYWSAPTGFQDAAIPLLIGVLNTEADIVAVNSGSGTVVADVEAQAIDALGRNVWYANAYHSGTGIASVVCTYALCSLTPMLPAGPPTWNSKQWTGDPPA